MGDHNILYEIYGEYIWDWRSINRQLNKWCQKPVHSIAEIKTAIAAYREKNNKDIPWQDPPWMTLLSHPKVAETAANMLNGAEQTRASIMQTAQTALALYQNPVVQKNTAVSDFTVRDLLDPAQAVSLYLCMEVDDVATVKPLSRLFINTILSKLIRNMKFDVNQSGKGAGKQRLLLMLDEFPQLGNMNKIEMALAVCAGYGIKMAIVSQDVNQLNKEYTKDNSISSNCHVHIYFTPNLDNGGATAKAISESLGKYTISTVSHSSGNNGWFSGSDSTSATSRDLMTPDEVSRMSPEEEIVFVAGHKPIHGKKLRYYLFPWFTKRIMPELLYSDACTKVLSYDDLFKVHEAERLDLEERIFEVKEEKAHMLLDSANDEKVRADQVVKEAQIKLEELKNEGSTKPMGKEARRQLAAAENQMAIAKNASSLAKAHIDIYHAELQIIRLERMISKIQSEKKNGSSLSDAFVTADMKLKEAQSAYEEAKKKLTEAMSLPPVIKASSLNIANEASANALPSSSIEPLSGDETMSFEDMDDPWEAKVWGFDPADEEEDGEEDMEILYAAEDDEDGEDNEGAAQSVGEAWARSIDKDDQYGRAIDGDKQEASPDGTWRASEKSGEVVEETALYDSQKHLQRLLFSKKTDDSVDDAGNGGGQVGRKRMDDETLAAMIPASPKHVAPKIGCFALDSHSWPVIRAKERVRRIKVMEIHWRQFPT